MQIAHINSFLRLSQEKNISKCSEKLHISQQGLSRQIKAMEGEVGCPLFLRTNKGVELTKEGELLLPEFQKSWDAYQQGLRALNDYQQSHQETIRVAVCPGIKQYFGLEFFNQFQQKNPDISLRLTFHSDIECEDALYHDDVDAAFLDWPEHKELYDNYLLIHSPLMAVVDRIHPLSHMPAISMQDLADQHVYIPDESHRMSQRFRQHWPDFYDSVIIDFATNEYEYFYKYLPKGGRGIALTFRFLCQDLDPDLVAIPVVEESFVDLYYCTKKEHDSCHALDCFSDFIYENVDVQF